MTAIDHARYTSGEVLGEGAQGVVVRVVDRERPSLPLVAKIPRARNAATSAHVEGEFALLARLHVPGLARVHDLARDARGVPFLVEDLVEGEEPRAWVGESSARLVALAVGLAETLAALHEAGFVHGDVKPANVRVPAGGRAMLLDLGAAVMVRSATIALTEAFAAPELRAGALPSPATDLYALGATLWASATGAPPGDRPASLRDAARWVTPSIAAVIERLVARHPADRPRSAVE
ncbi:MAG TPA: phosphotransferase, partial [Labilithrix sp.]|nr:phosphotransferase [Labilithrix sp.]